MTASETLTVYTEIRKTSTRVSSIEDALIKFGITINDKIDHVFSPVGMLESHAQCRAGENPAITSQAFLSLSGAKSQGMKHLISKLM